jgi:prepilin-type N-terminal cleavage/methylation domain-containing protein/prepilin-type processing-associated H-X9-DG protein
MNRKPTLSPHVQAFTLVELLTVVAIIGILSAITLTAVSQVREQAKAIQCAANLRSLGVAFHLFANDNEGRIPPSLHSAGSRREQNWAWQIQEYVNQNPVRNIEAWDNVFDQFYRCPTQPEEGTLKYSYGLNVYFELNPEIDSYEGSPATWSRFEDLPAATRTVLLGESRYTAFGDHFMAHDWGGIGAAKNAIEYDRHLGKANYLFADGNVQRLSVEETFDPDNQRNLWHPESIFRE